MTERWAARVMPIDVLRTRYLEGAEAGLAGTWVDDALIGSLPPDRAIVAMGLSFRMPDGSQPFEDAVELGLVRFPVTDAVLEHSLIDCSTAFGGELPDPPATAVWTGNGFAPGPGPLLPEYRMSRLNAPEATQLIRWTRIGRELLARRLRNEWVR